MDWRVEMGLNNGLEGGKDFTQRAHACTRTLNVISLHYKTCKRTDNGTSTHTKHGDINTEQ